eukprot:scaffold214336_cov23-Cyclotella_meneghiniana.AAC.1
MSNQIQEFYLEMKSYINTDRKLGLIEMLASSLPRMAKLILAECGFSQDYGPHNLVADVLTHHHAHILQVWCDLPYFIEVYKKVNRCGRAPEDASAMMNRLFPPAAAARPGVNNDDASQHDNSRTSSIVHLNKNQIETPARGHSNNTEEISALSSETPAAAQPQKLDGSGFMSAAQFASFIARLKPGDNFQAKAAEFCNNITLNADNPTNDNPNNDSNVPSSIGNLSHNSSSTTIPNPSPIRVLRNPYNKK